MAYGRRRYNPAAAERREREERERASFARARKRLDRYLSHFRKVKVEGAEAKRAWGLPQKSSYTLSRTSQGDYVTVTVRGSGRDLYLQEPTFLGWQFSKLVPTAHEHPELKHRGSPVKAYSKSDHHVLSGVFYRTRKEERRK